jgi:hypothetical protein
MKLNLQTIFKTDTTIITLSSHIHCHHHCREHNWDLKKFKPWPRSHSSMFLPLAKFILLGKLPYLNCKNVTLALAQRRVSCSSSHLCLPCYLSSLPMLECLLGLIIPFSRLFVSLRAVEVWLWGAGTEHSFFVLKAGSKLLTSLQLGTQAFNLGVWYTRTWSKATQHNC